MVTSIGPIPFATMVNREWGNTGQNYIKFIKPKQAAKASADTDDYEFEDEEDYINEDEPEQDEETEDTK